MGGGGQKRPKTCVRNTHVTCAKAQTFCEFLTLKSGFLKLTLTLNQSLFEEEDSESDGVAIAGPSSSAQLFADTFFATITSNKSVTKFF